MDGESFGPIIILIKTKNMSFSYLKRMLSIFRTTDLGYWLNIKNDQWDNRHLITGSMYENFEAGYPGALGGGLDCVAAKFNLNHEWALQDCNDNDYQNYALCQQMVRK